MIYPPRKKGSKLGEILPGLAETIDREHKRLLARKSIIEKRKEEHERKLLEMVNDKNFVPSSCLLLWIYILIYVNVCVFF